MHTARSWKTAATVGVVIAVLLLLLAIRSVTASREQAVIDDRYQFGGKTIQVNTRSVYYWFYRSQGVSIEVDPERHWWCLWVCTTTSDIDRIQCSIVLTGFAQEAQASGACNGCGSLNVMGPGYWGLGVPQGFQRVTYTGTVQINRITYPIGGAMLYTALPAHQIPHVANLRSPLISHEGGVQ
jgi:hypothetical protein